MPLMAKIQNADGSIEFTTIALDPSLSVQESKVRFRDAIWPQGRNLIYTWAEGGPITGEPTAPPPDYTQAAAAAMAAAVEPAFPFALVAGAAVVAFLIFRKKG